MVRRIPIQFSLLLSTVGLSALGCQSGGVGDPCLPEDEYRQTFPGYSATEVNVESRSFQCETRVCLVANFAGRVSCPYGQDGTQVPANQATDGFAREGNDVCFIPGTRGDKPEDVVDVAVRPRIVSRGPDQAVYCSCRCDGEDPSATYCECPSGFECRELVTDIGKGGAQLAGSYCIKKGTFVENPTALANEVKCDSQAQNCGPAHPFGVEN